MKIQERCPYKDDDDYQSYKRRWSFRSLFHVMRKEESIVVSVICQLKLRVYETKKVFC